jgi:hypothetical protein
MRNIIRICFENNLSLSREVREFLKRRTKEELTGVYNGN